LSTALKSKELLGYGIADAGQALINTLIGFYQMYFFTDVMRLPMHYVVQLFLLTKILDSVCFPIFGTLVDRLTRKEGAFRRLLGWIILPFFVSSVLLFVFDRAWDIPTRVAYTYGIVSLFVMISALLSVVYAGLVSSIAAQASDRARLSTVRFIFAFGASTAATFSIKYIVDYFGGKEGGGFYFVAFIFSVIATLALYITYITTTERVKHQRETDEGILKSLPLLFKNPAFLAPLIATAFTGLFVSVKSQTTLYFINYVMRREDIANYMLAAGTVSCAAGVAIVGLLINRIDRKILFTGLMTANALFIGAIYFIDQANASLIIACHCLNSMLGGACAPVIFSIYSDVVDHFDHSEGYRSPALINSIAMLAGRLGGSLGMVMAPLALAYFQYRPNEAQTATAMNGISLLFTAVPACFALLAAVAMIAYKITNEQAEATAKTLSGAIA
jgi:GPH family glycoside/pentoside/hexuronide:cation symporter